MTIDEVAGKLRTQAETGHGSEQLQVLVNGNLVEIESVSTFANDTGVDQVVLTVKEGSG